MKLPFLSVCFSALILLASCTKEHTLLPSGYTPIDHPPVHTLASDWTTESSLTWSSGTNSLGVYSTTDLIAPQLTEEMANNGAVLIYAKTSGSDSPILLPAVFSNTDNSEVDAYAASAETGIIHLSHTRFSDNAYVTPAVNDHISFRYILLGDVVPGNGRIMTNSGIEYNLCELKAMSYREVVATLDIDE